MALTKKQEPPYYQQSNVGMYRAILSQSGTSAPTVINVLTNTLGSEIIWTRNDIGDYYGTATAGQIFKKGKTFLNITRNDSTLDLIQTIAVIGNPGAGWENTVRIETMIGSSWTDNKLNYTGVEIIVYP